MNTAQSLAFVLGEAVTSGGIVVAVFTLTVTAAVCIFARTPLATIEGDPTHHPQGYHVYRGRHADKLRWLIRRTPGGLLFFYVTGAALFVLDELNVIVIPAFQELELEHVLICFEVLSFVAIVFCMYIVRLLVLVLANDS